MKKPVVPFKKELWDKKVVRLTQGFHKDHKAFDYAMPVGTELLAPQDGVVSQYGKDIYGGYWLYMKSSDGFNYMFVHISKDIWQTNYRGLAKGSFRSINKTIKRGQVIAYSGNTGFSTGPHTHYRMRKGKIEVNPSLYQVWGETEQAKPIPKPPTKPVDPCAKYKDEIIQLHKNITDLTLLNDSLADSNQVLKSKIKSVTTDNIHLKELNVSLNKEVELANDRAGKYQTLHQETLQKLKQTSLSFGGAIMAIFNTLRKDSESGAKD